MKQLLIFVLSSFFLVSCNSNAIDSPWDGEYQFGGYGGRTTGGSEILIEITVSINSPKQKYPCVFQAMGFQTDKLYVCSTSINGDLLEIHFKSDRDGYAEKRYKSGEILFSLQKTKDQSNQYAVRWGSYMPFVDMSQSDTFFEKVLEKSK